MNGKRINFKKVNYEQLRKDVIVFLDEYGNLFNDIFSKGSDGKEKFKNILNLTEYVNNEKGFFDDVYKQLLGANGNAIQINGIEIPYLFSLFILETLIPNKGFITITSIEQLEEKTGFTIPEDERKKLQKVIDTYPVRLSYHVIRQMKLSKAIAYQYMPFVDELNKEGLINTWVGQFHQGPLEQMYQNRPIFVLNMGCPVYCRFCFRKHKECRNQPSPTTKDVKEGMKHVKKQKKIKEILLTGGDPFMNESTLVCAIDEIMEVEHIRTLRIATRSISYYPHLFYDNKNQWLDFLKETRERLLKKGKKLEIATHFLHPDEISIQSLNVISSLVGNGIPVYVQTPFLKNCNESGVELVELYNALRGAGAEIHYIFMPCTPLQGNRRYVTDVESGIKAARYLRANLTDRAIPHICTATVIGKIDWFTSGWAIKKVDENFIWIRTPYDIKYFKEFCSDFNLDNFKIITAKENEEGTIDVKFMVKIGDDKLFLGSRSAKSKKSKIEISGLSLIQKEVLKDQRNSQSIVATPEGIIREHKTRLEIDLNSRIDLGYIRKDRNITDVVIASEHDVIDDLVNLKRVIKEISEIDSVVSIRIRSLKFNYSPESFSQKTIDILGKLNKLSMVNPKRVEIETQFIHSSEAKEEHKDLVRQLNSKGITVYNNTPILGGINDDEKELERIANHLRYSGIEFNAAYILGKKIHQFWNRNISVGRVLDIASNLRKYGSGREIPRYLLSTEYGDVDFGISTEFFKDKNKAMVRLLCYDKEYFNSISSELNFDDKEHPEIELKNLFFEDDFMIIH